MLSEEWTKSTWSGNGGNCVEVRKRNGHILVRDTKNRAGGVQAYTPDEWRAFVQGVKFGEFDLDPIKP